MSNIIGIIGAMDIEVVQIISHLENKIEKKIAGQFFYKGKIKNTEVVVTCSGIGKVNSSISAQILISEFNVSCIINTGIAGNMSENLKIKDIVIANKLMYHDFDKELLKQNSPFCEYFLTSKELILKAENSIISINKNNNLHYEIGAIITGDLFLQDSKIKNELKEKFNPLCIEMEGASIAHVCKRNEIDFLVIRSISDTAEDGAEEIYNNFKNEVANISSNIVINLIENI